MAPQRVSAMAQWPSSLISTERLPLPLATGTLGGLLTVAMASVRTTTSSLAPVARGGAICGLVLAVAVQLLQPTPLRALLIAVLQPAAAVAAPGQPAALGSLPPLN